MRDVLDRYRTEVLPSKPRNARSQGAQLAWWREKLGLLRVADVTPDVLSSFKMELLRGVTARGTPRSPSTVVRYLALLSHVFSRAEKEWGYASSNPLRSVSKPREARG